MVAVKDLGLPQTSQFSQLLRLSISSMFVDRLITTKLDQIKAVHQFSFRYVEFSLRMSYAIQHFACSRDF